MSGGHTLGCAVWQGRPCDCRRGVRATTRALCGTERGYHAHLRQRTRPCPECRAAHAAKERLRVTGTAERRPLVPCGTRTAYQRHQRLDEVPCRACTDANTAWFRAQREQQTRQGAAA
ncbi:MAG: hypothetical protein L0I76_16285 [Pseudonocardia sp.]|nr:hypothetical protein [Pseudonocardia sp.]